MHFEVIVPVSLGWIHYELWNGKNYAVYGEFHLFHPVKVKIDSGGNGGDFSHLNFHSLKVNNSDCIISDNLRQEKC